MDQLIENSLAVKSVQSNDKETSEEFIEEAMHADISGQSNNQSNDDNIIQKHLEKSGVLSLGEAGSSILYEAMHDVD